MKLCSRILNCVYGFCFLTHKAQLWVTMHNWISTEENGSRRKLAVLWNSAYYCKWPTLYLRLPVLSLWYLSFPTLGLQCRKCYFLVRNIGKSESDRGFLSWNKGCLSTMDYLLNWGCHRECAGPPRCTQHGTSSCRFPWTWTLGCHQRLFFLHCPWGPSSVPTENLWHFNSGMSNCQEPNERKSWYD